MRIEIQPHFMIPEPTIVSKQSKPPYLIGLLCLLPLIGALVGLILLLMGLFQYKDKRLSIIGAAGIVWTIVIYSWFNYASKNYSIFKDGFADIAQMQLNSLVKNIEYYKLIHGEYPERLEQLLQDDKSAPIVDPAMGMTITKTIYFNYEKAGEQYTLFSSGQDGIPNTADDLFPQVTAAESKKIGLIPHR